MIKELILHLGDTKTGSTSIQKALVTGAGRVPGKTILYPSTSNHVALAKTLTQPRRAEQRDQRFGRLARGFANSDADYGIVSAEHFQVVDPEDLARAIETYWPDLRDRVRLIAYARPHGEKFLSSFAERSKLGGPAETLEDFFDVPATTEVFMYAPRFRRWRDLFGDRFTLRPFVRSSLYQGDVVADFFRFLAKGTDFELGEVIAANTSLTTGQLALLREAHDVINARIQEKSGPRFREARAAVGRLAGEHLRDMTLGRDTPKLALTRSAVARIRERYAKDAEALDAEFFDATPMSDALAALDKKAVDAQQSLRAQDYFPQDTIDSVRLMAHVLAEVLQRHPIEVRDAIGKARKSADGADEET